MKQIFTLFSLMFLLSAKSNGQSTPLFENFTGKTISNLSSSGWVFASGISIGSTTSNGEGLQFASPSAANGTSNSTITTSSFTITESFTNISFKYGVIATLNGTRTIEYGFINSTTNAFSTLGTITLTGANTTSNTLYVSSLNISAAPGTTTKLHFIVGAQNDKNAHLIIDDIKVASSAQAPLPIKLLSFTGSLSNNRAQLSWSVADNETGDQFQIEKSLDGRNFTTEAIVSTTSKEGTDNYSYAGTQEITANTSYRLKIINKNNTTSYSRVLYLKRETNSNQDILLLQNPIGASLGFTYNAASAGLAAITVYNPAGLKVFSFNAAMQKGSNTIIQAVDNKLATGNYILEVATTTERKTIKITK